MLKTTPISNPEILFRSNDIPPRAGTTKPAIMTPAPKQSPLVFNWPWSW